MPETSVPDDAALTFAFKEGWREHSNLCDHQADTEGGREDKSAGMDVDRNRLNLPQFLYGYAASATGTRCAAIDVLAVSVRTARPAQWTVKISMA